MEPEIVENIRYKYELHRLIKDDEISSISTGIPSDPFIDENIIITSTPNPEELPEENADNNISYSVLYSKADESKEMGEDDIDLYSDLVKIEEEEKKTKQKHELEYENIKKQLKKLQESEAKNNKRLEQLTTENTNLMKSICSLYRTVKREIEFKDNLLADANARNTKLKSIMYVNQNANPGKCPFCQTSISDEKTDKNSHKRKRSKSPETSNKKREYKSCASKISSDSDLPVDKNTKDAKREFKSSTLKTSNNSNLISENYKNVKKEYKNIQKTVSDLLIVKDYKDTKNEYKPNISKTNDISHLLFGKDSKNTTAECSPSSSKTDNDLDLSLKKPNSLLSKVDEKHNKDKQNDNPCVLFQPPQSSSTDNSCDSGEANNILFNMLPEALKNSFYEYEKNQIASLNRLKQSLINEYSTFDASTKSSSLGSIPRGQEVQMNHKSSESVSNVSIELLSTVNSKLINKTDLSEKYEKHESKDNMPETTKKDSMKSNKVTKNCFNSRAMKKDVSRLFQYRSEVMPISEKRKFGMHRSGKRPYS